MFCYPISRSSRYDNSAFLLNSSSRQTTNLQFSGSRFSFCIERLLHRHFEWNSLEMLKIPREFIRNILRLVERGGMCVASLNLLKFAGFYSRMKTFQPTWLFVRNIYLNLTQTFYLFSTISWEKCLKSVSSEECVEHNPLSSAYQVSIYCKL